MTTEQELIGYEHHEYRPYGAPGEIRIHAILVSQYLLPDGSISSDFQWLINAYKESKNTIKLVPLYTAASNTQCLDARKQARKEALEEVAKLFESKNQGWHTDADAAVAFEIRRLV